jgi:hypothetical protein
VSPLWRDETEVWISPGEVGLRRMRRGIHPSCVAETTRTVDSDSMDWRPAVAVLDACLAENEWQGARARLVVSNLWVRYAIVPWSDAVANEDERCAHASICLAETYGALGPEWHVCLSEGEPGQARIVCAIHEGLLAALRSTLAARRGRMLSLQPALIAAHNRWRERLPQSTGWFVHVEDGGLAAVRLTETGWDRVYTARIGADWAIELSRLRTFARLAAQSSASSRVFVDAPTRLRRLATRCESDIEWLEAAEPAASLAARRWHGMRLHT